MRVCHVIPTLGVGGTERQLLLLAPGLAAGNDVTVVCTKERGPFAEDMRECGVRVLSLGLRCGWDPRARGRLARVFRDRRPDVVHTFLFGFDYPANAAARACGVPVVVSSRRQLAAWKKPRHIRLQCKANALVDCIIANARAVADFACNQEGADPALYRVIHNGVDVEAWASSADPIETRARYHVPEGRCIVGMVANFSPVKDHDLFLDIAAELVARRPDVHFLLAGAGRGARRVMDRARGTGLEPRVTCVATVNELPHVYAIMDVCLLCSRSEGFPNAAMEAMPAGRPTVSAAVGGIPELVRHDETGFLVSSRDPNAFADAVERVLDNPGESGAMGAKARDWVRGNLGVDRMVAAHQGLYAELLAAKGKG